jgi:hypothetical protein
MEEGMHAWARVVAVVNRVVLPTLPACTDSHPAMTHGPWPIMVAYSEFLFIEHIKYSFISKEILKEEWVCAASIK